MKVDDENVIELDTRILNHLNMPTSNNSNQRNSNEQLDSEGESGFLHAIELIFSVLTSWNIQ